MATITISPVIVELAAPVLMALIVGALLAAENWLPARKPRDPAWPMGAAEIGLVALGIAVWQAVVGNAAACAVVLVAALVAFATAARLARLARR